jgi:hypothetical protein
LFYVDGSFSAENKPIKIKSYGIHRDPITGRWLFVYETSASKHITMIFDGADVMYETDTLRYSCSLEAIAFYNNTIYTAHDKLIRGFNFRKNEYKDFNCDVVTDGASLVFHNKQIHVINDTSIYRLG